MWYLSDTPPRCLVLLTQQYNNDIYFPPFKLVSCSFSISRVCRLLMSVTEEEKALINPVIVSYCTICSLPPEYCKYGPMWDLHTGEKTVASANTPVVAESKNSSAVISIKIAPRIGRRYLTTISGLEKFDVDIGKACKVFAKKFACGVGSKDSEIEIQGDVEESIIETITSNWKQIKSRNLVIRRKEK